MTRVSNSVDYSVLYECESKVDSSFRKLRLSHSKLKKTISDAHEGYLRKILDVRRKQEADEQSALYNKRRKQKQKLENPLEEGRTEQEKTINIPDPIEETYSDSCISDIPSPKPMKEPIQSSNDFASSPYRRTDSIAASKPKAQRRGLQRVNTMEILSADEDLSREFAEGRISKAQYHKMLLLRNRMIHVMCLEDLDETGENKSWEVVEREKVEAEKELQRTIARYPKAYALLHPRSKAVPSNAYCTAFRPHRDVRKPVSETKIVAVKAKEMEKGEHKSTSSYSHSYRQQFFVSTRPGTACGLGGGTSLRAADPRHGGRLSAQNMVNYLLNKPTPSRKPSHIRISPAPAVRHAVQKARDRVIEERSRSVPRLESVRLQNLQKGRLSQAGSRTQLEVGVDIPSTIGTPRMSKESSGKRLSKAKRTSLRDLLDL